MILRLVLTILGMSGLLLAQEGSEKSASVTQTGRMDFPPNGTLHVRNSLGLLTVEGWDRPDMEYSVTKSPQLAYDARRREEPARGKELEEVEVNASRNGSEVIVTISLPHRRNFPIPSRLRGAPLLLDYRIRVPRGASLIVDHDGGEVNVEGLIGDIQATTPIGQINLRLPDDANYWIDAKTDLGGVVSDLPGITRRRIWLLGHRFAPDEASGRKLYLRTGAGDIVILKMRTPAPPPPLRP